MRSASIGQRFGSLVVHEYISRRGWKVACICDCGNQVVRGLAKLKKASAAGRLPCCPVCVPKRISVAIERKAYRGMMDRCYNEKTEAFKHYGGRGITVHPHYLGFNGFPHFLEDIGPRPAKGYYIDRINNDLGYEPGNLKWSTAKESTRNRRCTKLFEFQGQVRTIQEIADAASIPYILLYNRLVKYRWEIIRAITTPPHAEAVKNLPTPTEHYLFKGEMLTRAEIVQRTGIPYSRLDRRIKAGMTAEQAVSIPVIPRGIGRRRGIMQVLEQ